MNSIFVVCTIFLLFCCIKIHSQPIYAADDDERNTGYHPFPEMSRFLNSHSRIHRPSTHSTFSILTYLCSAADNEEKLEEILNTFPTKSRTLIMKIILQDCENHNQRYKRTTININQNNFPRMFLRNINDHYHKV